MNTYLLVFDDGSDPQIDVRSYVDTLDSSAEVFTLDGHVCFLKSNLPIADLADKWLKFAGSSLFFIAEITRSEYYGRMPGVFWDFVKQQSFESAAE